jgi:hypothetical protein
MTQTRIRQSQRKNMSLTEQTQLPEVVDQAVETNDAKNPQESFAELRRAKDALEKELWQAKKEKELLENHWKMQAQASSQPQAPQEEEFDYRQLEQEEYPDGKKLVKALNSFNRKMTDYEKKLTDKDQKIQVLELMTEFSDFKDIVTPENIDKYIKSDEDNREAVETAKNPLRKVYNLIKKSAAYQADKSQSASHVKQTSQEEKRIQDKEKLPKTSSIGVRSEAVSTAASISNSGMSKEMKLTLWKEMQQLSRK